MIWVLHSLDSGSWTRGHVALPPHLSRDPRLEEILEQGGSESGVAARSSA